MIGCLNKKDKKVTVIGGGIAGLLAAYHLDKQGYQVTLFEKEKQAGGLIATLQTPYGIAEQAAHSLLACAAVKKLAEELNLSLLPVNKKSRARYILRHGKMQRLPLSLKELAITLHRAIFARAPGQHTTMKEWALTHLGEPALDYLLSPFILGIYGVKPEELSVQAAFPRLATLPGETIRDALKRTVTQREKKIMSAFAHGSGALTAALSQYLQQSLGSRFHLGQKVTKLPTSGNMIIATPAYVAAELLASVDKKLSAALKNIRYSPFVAATVFTEKDKMRKLPRGVGLLIPPKENRDILGILFNSSSFLGRVNDERYASFTVMMGGSLKPELVSAPEEKLRQIITTEFDDLFGGGDAIVHIHFARWKKGIPVYDENILELRQTALARWCARPGHILFGNYTGNVSLRGMIEAAAAIIPQ